MVSRALNVVIVDDDAISRAVTMEALSDEPHRVSEFSCGADLLAAGGEQPDVILLDIEMPVMDGISVCRALRAEGNDHSLVLFVSSHDDVETRLAAYAAGGSDFIVKPVEPLELIEKIRIAGEYLARRQELAHQAQYAQQAAFTAMSSMGEMGAVLHFLRESFACTDPEQLSGRLFDALRQYDLEGLAEFRGAQGSRTYSSRGEITPLEQSILGHARGMDRIFNFRDRLVINYPTVTLLALNLPLADPDRIGRLRDHLAVLAEGTAARIAALEAEAQRRAQTEALLRAAVDLTDTLDEIERSHAENRVAAMEINADYLRELTAAFVHLGLSDDQEASLTSMAQEAHARMEALIDADRSTGERLHEVAARLRALG